MMPDSLERFVKPIPIMQWLVVIVLSAQIITSQAIVHGNAALFILGLILGNVVLLRGLPKIMSSSAVASTLVILDTILVPSILYATGTSGTDLFIVYFGIIMIAGATGNLKRALILAAITCVAYMGFWAFMVYTQQETIPISTLLLRLPFLLIMTLFYGALAEFAQRERSHKEQLAHDALHDELTGMPNRRHLLDSLSRALEEAKRFNSPLSCAVMDVDHFKEVNDTYGHDMGDLVLRDYSSLLAVQSRGYDLAGRLGGDEYVWILPRVEKDGALVAGERLREAVERYQFGNGSNRFKLTTCVGLTTYIPGQSAHPNPAQMLKTADLALYVAKREGRNRVCHLPMSEGVVGDEDAEPVRQQGDLV